MNRFFDTRGDASRQLAPWTEEVRKAGGKALFELLEPVRFRSDLLGGVIEIYPPYLSDLASIPQFAWSLFMAPDDPKIELGGWVHDLLYQCRGTIWMENRFQRYSRVTVDRVLAYEAMPELGASRMQCDLVYQALRRFGDQWPGQTLLEHMEG